MNSKKKLFAGVAVALSAIVMLTGVMFFTACGETNGEETSRTDLKGTVTITGSTSVEEVMGPLVDAFMALYPNVTINVTGSGSGTGISDAKESKNDFGMASRELKSSETGVVAKKIADDGIALVVNTANTTVTDVTADEVYNLYTDYAPIQNSVTAAIGREASSGTRGAFDELVKNSSGTDLTAGYSSSVTLQNSTGGVKTAVTQDADAMGYISLGSVDSSVKTVKYEGVEATLANIKNGSYKLARPFNLVLKGDDVETAVSEMSAAAQAFYHYILSPDGQEIVNQKGYISLYL